MNGYTRARGAMIKRYICMHRAWLDRCWFFILRLTTIMPQLSYLLRAIAACMYLNLYMLLNSLLHFTLGILTIRGLSTTSINMLGTLRIVQSNLLFCASRGILSLIQIIISISESSDPLIFQSTSAGLV